MGTREEATLGVVVRSAVGVFVREERWHRVRALEAGRRGWGYQRTRLLLPLAGGRACGVFHPHHRRVADRHSCSRASDCVLGLAKVVAAVLRVGVGLRAHLLH
jgi:hypothetical protein